MKGQRKKRRLLTRKDSSYPTFLPCISFFALIYRNKMVCSTLHLNQDFLQNISQFPEIYFSI